MEKGAHFSPDGQYRYSLWRIWNKQLPLLGVTLLNPSTATAETDDPTVHRQGERARHLGFGGLIVTNIFAFRSTDPEKLYEVSDPVGPENDGWIVQEMKRCQLQICGWGKHGAYRGRGVEVCRMLGAVGIVPHALHVNGDGSPAHPLYLPYHIKPFAYQQQECHA